MPGKCKPKEQRRGKPKRKKVSRARLRLADWTIVLTNVPQEMLTVEEALVLVRARWQIELFWKLCKQYGKLDTWGSYNQQRTRSRQAGASPSGVGQWEEGGLVVTGGSRSRTQ